MGWLWTEGKYGNLSGLFKINKNVIQTQDLMIPYIIHSLKIYFSYGRLLHTLETQQSELGNTDHCLIARIIIHANKALSNRVNVNI